MNDQQLDMFDNRKFGTNWISPKERYEDKRNLISACWDLRKSRRERGYRVSTTTGEVFGFDIKSLWISRAKQNEKEHEKLIIQEFDSRLS